MSIPVVYTPQQQEREAEIRLLAELQKVSQARSQAERELNTAREVGRMLFQEHINNPIRQVQHNMRQDPPPPQPPPSAAPAPTPQAVQEAVQQAMMGERRSLKQLLVEHGQSMKNIVDRAREKASTKKKVRFEGEAAPASSSSDSVMRTSGSTQSVIQLGNAQKRTSVSEETQQPRPRPTPTAAPASARPSSAPTAVPTAARPSSDSKAARRRELLQKRPMSANVAVLSGAKRSIPADVDLEEIQFFERVRRNEGQRILDRARAAARRQKRPIGDFPNQSGSKRVPPEGGDVQRVPKNPATRIEAEQIGRKLAQELVRRQTQKKVNNAIAEARQIQEASRRRNPNIRMDQQDYKRTLSEMEQEINEIARRRTGMGIDDIHLPKKRKILVGPSRPAVLVR